MILNAYHDVVVFTLPAIPEGTHWKCLVDTNIPDRMEEPMFESGQQFEVTGRSLLLFVLQNGHSHSEPAPQPRGHPGSRRSDDPGRA
jgi:glycogen operon protein